MSLTNKENVDRVMQGLPPEARAALNVMSQMQQRPPEDVLRDEIKNYIEGRLPRIDIEGAIKALRLVRIKRATSSVRFGNLPETGIGNRKT